MGFNFDNDNYNIDDLNNITEQILKPFYRRLNVTFGFKFKENEYKFNQRILSLKKDLHPLLENKDLLLINIDNIRYHYKNNFGYVFLDMNWALPINDTFNNNLFDYLTFLQQYYSNIHIDSYTSIYSIKIKANDYTKFYDKQIINLDLSKFKYLKILTIENIKFTTNEQLLHLFFLNKRLSLITNIINCYCNIETVNNPWLFSWKLKKSYVKFINYNHLLYNKMFQDNDIPYKLDKHSIININDADIKKDE